jgi:hypothetical protein
MADGLYHSNDTGGISAGQTHIDICYHNSVTYSMLDKYL